MKILSIEYHDKEYDWSYKPIELSSNLTLMVGISGAGKTQILKSIFNLKKIANGASLNGVKWNVTFQTRSQVIYRWDGEFETEKFDQDLFQLESEDTPKGFNLLTENLYKDENHLIQRDAEKIIFKHQTTPKLSPTQSIIHLLNQEEDIYMAKEELDRIYFSDPDRTSNGIYGLSLAIFKKCENYSLDQIQESDIPIPIKLSLIYRKFPDQFQIIKQKFIDIFTQIEDIKIEPIDTNNFSLPMSLSKILNESTVISLKEKGIISWIKQSRISAGMFKTLMCLSELFLLPKGSLILIDEFENSLGVNCLDSLADTLLSEERDLQIIMTSHHPYIINNINPSHWKIITRKGGIVTVKNAQDWGIRPSRQKAFIDLINLLEEYPEGIDQA
ncbi:MULTISPECIES: AAA family ATPase [Planktothrix]|jgi:ABC-type dipeptide/oligopeptide/nickel transport system ATPase component|uniref:ATPase AAA-type core domain-containing protein n=1 Tax=Planktothrix rubescens CCAP 1459/22 TaxID=329571 RepID=A0A6J7ZF91_PLARU|nr:MULTISPECIES: AAA family ATPase [Planktothrix]CAC5340013.1 conserved hypothetical protein [Planktothrix rubescens NIVA-CYA 18]CAD5948530.1 hypothetical protein PCC7821_02378 [Planktothrix rubescens NIVA-CYA 18]